MWRKAVAAALWATPRIRSPGVAATGTPGAPEASTRTALIGAVRQGRGLTREQATELEAALVADPAASAARAKLLGYYYHRAPDQIGVAPAIEARRRHVLWLVRHDPASALGLVCEALISPRGPVLPDPTGFAQGREAWLAQVESHPDDTAVRFNAFMFLMLHDRVAAERLAMQGRERHGSDLTWDSGLGTLYAFGILGIDGTNMNGLPTSVDLAAQDDAFARRAIAVLKASTNPALGGAAGAYLTLWGPLIWKMKPGALDRSEPAESLLVRAQAMDVRNPAWGRSLAEFYEFRSSAAPTPAERAAVLDYLEACRKFWTYPRSPLERWIRELREGGRPDLSGQPDY